jgi:hypothetical protein
MIEGNPLEPWWAKVAQSLPGRRAANGARRADGLRRTVRRWTGAGP